MHHTKLHFRFREDGLDGFWKALETINTGDQDIANASVGEIGQNLQPEVGSFVL